MARKVQYELKKPRNDPSMKRKETNLPAKKYKHTNPTELRLSFELAADDNHVFLDLSSALSCVNRKSFRQGAYYYVQKVEFYDNATGYIDLFTIADNWVSKNAYIRGKAIYDEMNEHVLKRSGNVAGKYADFKVYMSDTHRILGTKMPSMYYITGTAEELVQDSWSYSKYVVADSDQDSNADPDSFYIHMLGPHGGTTDDRTSVGLIKSYGSSRARPESDSTPETNSELDSDPLVNIFDFSDEEQMNLLAANLRVDNTNVPYDNDKYIGQRGSVTSGVSVSSQYQQVARLSTVQDNHRVAVAPGFCAPLGLVGIDASAATTTCRVVITLAEGTYNGVYAEGF